MDNPVNIVRKRDIQVVQRFIRNVGSYCILNLYAPAGFGRTIFLKRILEEHNGKEPVVYVYVPDFVNSNEMGEFSLKGLLLFIIDSLQSYQLGYTNTRTSSAAEPSEVIQGNQPDFGNDVILLQQSQKIVNLIVEAIDRGMRPLLLLDDYHLMPQDIRTMFENMILSKIVDPPNQAITIIGTEREMRFTNRLDLRIRLKTHRLTALTEEDIAQSLPQHKLLASDILRWTGGVPELVTHLVNNIYKRGFTGAEQYQAHKEELIGQDYKEKINSIVSSDVTIESIEVIDVLAVLRRFDVSLLRSVLPDIYPYTFISYKQRRYLNLIQGLGSRVYWRGNGGYALDNTLRALISSYMRVFNAERYRKINEVIVDVYIGWLQEEYRLNYLVEMLYHQKLLLQEDTTADTITGNISITLLEYIEGKKGRGIQNIDELDALRQTLLHDSELIPFINEDAFNVIYGLLRKGLDD